MKLRKYDGVLVSLRNKFSFVLLLVIIFTYLMICRVNKNITPVLINYASVEMERISTSIINDAVYNHVNQNISVDDLMVTTYNDKKEIVSVDFNTMKVNEILNSITSTIEDNLISLESNGVEVINTEMYSDAGVGEGIIYEIPMGLAYNNPILNNLGPKIPFRISLIGSVVSNVKTDLVDYGLNNVMITISIEVMVSEEVIMPFISEKSVMSSNIPILIKMIQGSIPSVYGGTYSVSSPIVSSSD